MGGEQFESGREASEVTRRSFIGKGGVLMGGAFGLSALLAACGGDEGATTTAAAGGGGKLGAGKSLALVSAEKAGDQGPVDDLVTWLKRCDQDFGIKTRFIEATDPSSYESTLRGLCQAKTAIIAMVFPNFVDSVKAVAPEYPDTKFVFLYADPYKPTLANVRTIAYGTSEAAYLGGVLAASVTSKKQVGYITGVAIPNVNSDFHAFEAGVKSVNPAIGVKGAAVGSFTDPVKARQVAAALYGSGIDVALTSAGGASLGVMKAAAEHNGLLIYDTIAPVPGTPGDDHVIGTTVFKYGQSLHGQVKQALSAGWRAGAIEEGVKEKVADLELSEAYLSKGDPAVVERIQSAVKVVDKDRDAIASGALVIKHDTSAF